MARVKRESDELYNQRRRAKRELERLNRQKAGATTVSRREALTALTTELKRGIDATYQRKGRTREEQREAAKNITDLVNATKRGATTRRDKEAVQERRTAIDTAAFKAQARQARARSKELERTQGVGAKSREQLEIEAFYASTSRVWSHGSKAERDQLIIEAVRAKYPDRQINSILDAFNLFREQPEYQKIFGQMQKEAEYALKVARGEGIDEDDIAMLEAPPTVAEYIDSPPFWFV